MDLMSVCRTCMSSTTLNPIFPIPEVHERFSKAIYLVTGLKITFNDGLPQKMCIECLKRVNDAMKFRAKCKETEESLLKIKTELRRAIRHNESIVNCTSDYIREIKVENRWIKVDHTNNVTVVNNDVEDEQPLMHLLNPQENNNMHNIYITETNGQMIPLDMLKVEINSSTEYTEEAPNNSEIAEADYCIRNIQDSDNNQEDTMNDLEDPTNDPDNSVKNEEISVSKSDNAVDVPANTYDDSEHQFNDSEYTIDNTIDETIIDSKVTVNEPEYILTNIEDNVKDHKNMSNEAEVTLTYEEDAAIDAEEIVDSQAQTLKTYYILKDNATSPDTMELNNVETDDVDNSEFDNINVSNNQEIIVMDNRESLYVIDMSNPSSKRVTCKLCQKNLSIRSIDLHLSKSHPGADGRRVKCQLCDNFVVREKMVQHRLVMHGAEAFQCRYCKWQFEKEDALIEHVVTCTAKKKRKACESGKELVECDVCHKTMQKASLKLHTDITHAGLRPVCDHCGKSFGNKFRLNEHCRAKHGYEKFKCSNCDFQSASSLALTNHERRHRGEKPYVCEQCGAKFHAAYLLTQHRHSHRTDRKFKCEICSVSFKTNNGLHSHRRTCHGGARRLRSGRTRDSTDAPSEINDL